MCRGGRDGFVEVGEGMMQVVGDLGVFRMGRRRWRAWRISLVRTREVVEFSLTRKKEADNSKEGRMTSNPILGNDHGT